jgi:hypothetical protein
VAQESTLYEGMQYWCCVKCIFSRSDIIKEQSGRIYLSPSKRTWQRIQRLQRPVRLHKFMNSYHPSQTVRKPIIIYKASSKMSY